MRVLVEKMTGRSLGEDVLTETGAEDIIPLMLEPYQSEVFTWEVIAQNASTYAVYSHMHLGEGGK